MAVARVVSRFGRKFSSYSNVLIEDRGPVRIVSINRPEKKNCVNTETSQELYDAFVELENDSSVLVGILAGKGNTFCSGYDLKEVSEIDLQDHAHTSASLPLEPFSMNSRGPMGPSRLVLSKPVIASVTGYAVAGGLELALWCDLRVAEDSAVMGVFCRRYGVPLIDGGSVRLPMLIGLSHALDLILTGRGVSADEGLKMGLVNRVVADGTGLDESLKLANQIASFPQACLHTDRQSAITAANKFTEESMKREFEQGTFEQIIYEAIHHSKFFKK